MKLLYGVTDKLMRQVQSVQNAAARLITEAKRREHITPILRQLHWLPARRRVEFKTAIQSAVKQSTWLSGRRYSSRLRKFCSLPQVLFGEKVLRVVLVTDVLLQLDHVFGTTSLPVCETMKSAAQNSEDMFQTDCGASRLFLLLHLINALTYLLA